MEDGQRPREWTGTVSAGEAGGRLDLWLAGRLGELSRIRVKGLIEGGKVLVEGRVVKAGYRVRVGERVVVTIPPAP